METGKVDNIIARKLEVFSDWEVGPDVTVGDRTFKTLKFTWNRNPSVEYFLDCGTSAFVVCGFEMDFDDPDMKAFLESVGLSDRMESDWNKATQVKSADVKM